MSKGTVLISGINGYIASTAAGAYLDDGYSVRGTVRNASSAKPLLGALQNHVDQGRVEIVEVPDITADGAFDEAVKGVTAIAHLAAPVSLSFTDPGPVIHAAVNGTRTILDSARKNAGTQLKSFVIMSSIAAVLNDYEPPYTYTEKDWNEHSEQAVREMGNSSPSLQIYRASKTAAEKVMWEFEKTEQPSFTLTAINPVFVMGPPFVLPISVDKIHETTVAIYQILAGQPIPPSLPGGFVDVRDVARLLVWVTNNAAEAKGERYLAVGGVNSNQAVADILVNAYPERDIQKGNPGEGYPADFKFPPHGIVIDGSKAIKATGQEFIRFEQTVLDAAKAFEKFL